MKDPRFELAAVCSRRMDTGSEFLKKHGQECPVYNTVAGLVADSSIDAVYVASPNFMHCTQTVEALEAGKHVLCEKAFASNSREALRMIELARRQGLTLLEAMIPVLSPQFDAVVKALPRIGRVRRYFASYCQYSSRYDNLKRGIVANAFKPELSNGAVMDIGVYCLYPMVALFGKPQNLFSQCVKLSTGADGQGTVVAGYDGFDAVAIYSKIADSTLPTEIQGEEGTIVIDHINSPSQVLFKPRDKSLPVEDLTVSAPLSPYYYEMKTFIDMAAGMADGSVYSTPRATIETMEVIDEIRRQCGLIFPAD